MAQVNRIVRAAQLLVALSIAALSTACARSPSPESSTSRSATPTSVPQSAAPRPTAAAATATPLPPLPTLAPATATPAPRRSVVWVGNTDGQGVFLRRTPSIADRMHAYPDGTPLQMIGADVQAEGRFWHHVQAPDGQNGYVPAEYVVAAQPDPLAASVPTPTRSAAAPPALPASDRGALVPSSPTNPTSSGFVGGGDKPVHVSGYTRSDGTYVSPYNRALPGTASHSGTSSGRAASSSGHGG